MEKNTAPSGKLSVKFIALAVLVAVLIVGGAGLVMAANKGDSKKEEAAQSEEDKVIVATVNGTPVYRPEVVRFVEALPPQVRMSSGDKLYPLALDQIVNAKIVSMKAESTDIAKDPEVAERMEQAKEEIIRAVFLEKEIEKKVTEDRLQKAYKEFEKKQGKTPQILANHILVESEDKANELIKKLQDGGSFEELAKEHSTDPTGKATGGNLGWFSEKDMVPEFAGAAFALKKGEITKAPVKTQFGWHIIRVEDTREKPVPTFEEVREGLAVQERREILEETLKAWRSAAKVKLFDLEGNPLKAAKAE